MRIGIIAVTFCRRIICFTFHYSRCFIKTSVSIPVVCNSKSVLVHVEVLLSLFQVVTNQLPVVKVQQLKTKRFLEQVAEEGLEEGEGEEVIIYRQREEGTCYGAALGARPPRGPVLAAGKFWCVVYIQSVA